MPDMSSDAGALKQALAETERLREQVAYKDSVIDQRHAMLTTATRERDSATARALAAEADNAALLAQLTKAAESIRTFAHAESCTVADEYDPDDTEGCRCVLSALQHLKPQEHPGASLLSEVQRLRAAVEWTRAYLQKNRMLAAVETLALMLGQPVAPGLEPALDAFRESVERLKGGG